MIFRVTSPKEGSGKKRRLRRRTLEHALASFSTAALMVRPAWGIVMSGKIAQGIRLIEDSIVAADVCGQSYGMQPGIGLRSPRFFYEMLGSKMPRLRVILRNIGTFSAHAVIRPTTVLTFVRRQ